MASFKLVENFAFPFIKDKCKPFLAECSTPILSLFITVILTFFEYSFIALFALDTFCINLLLVSVLAIIFEYKTFVDGLIE